MSDNQQPERVAAPDRQSLRDWLKPQCSRLMYSKCTTLYCLRRGGYTGEPADASIATCEPYELFNLLQQSTSERCGDLQARFRAEVFNWIARRRIQNVAISEADALVKNLVSIAATGTGEEAQREVIDVAQQHDFIQIKGSDRCGLRDCTLGVLEHAWIPPWTTPPAPSAAPEAPCNHERELGKKVLGCFDCYPPSATSEPARETAQEIARNITQKQLAQACLYTTLEPEYEAGQKSLEAIAAIISKHIPDAGEVERLRDKVDSLCVLRFSDYCQNCGPKFRKRSSFYCAGCGAPMAWSKAEGRLTYSDRKRQVEQLRAELSDARANAIREAVAPRLEQLTASLDHAAWKGFNQADSDFERGYKHAMQVAAKSARQEMTALQSLLDKKEGEDGPV